MTLSQIKTAISKMDQTTEEFFDLYVLMSEKYFTFENPDEYQRAGQLLNMILLKGEPHEVELVVKIYSQLFEMLEKKVGAVSGSFGIKDKEIFFQFYENPEQIDKLQKMLRNTVMVKANEERGQHEK